MPTLQSVTLNMAKVMDQVPNLKFWGDPVLHTKTTFSSFEEAFKVCEELERSLRIIRELTGFGRGIAAPQIGSLERCFVTFVEDEYQYFINPTIESSSSETNWYREMCLSISPVRVDVERPREITMSYMDKEGKQHTKTFDTFWARLIQHEYDHLEGILNVDRADPKDMDMNVSNLTKETLRDNK